MQLKIQNLVRISITLIALITITWADCTICNCQLQDELETIICKDRFINFPRFKSNTQMIEISKQKIPTLSNSFFKNLQLLQKLYVPNNEIENIAEDTFKTLKINALDLSHNKITDLKVRTFQDLSKIQVLELNHNQIELIQNGLFRNLEFLEELHLEHNNISVIEENAFGNNFQLTFLNIRHNLLKRLNINLGKDLNNLRYLLLEENSWTCNCENKNLITNLLYNKTGSVCTEPNTLYNKPYSSLTENDFNCNTTIEIKQNLVIVQEHNLTAIDCELLNLKSFMSWTEKSKNFLISNTVLNKTQKIHLPIEFYQIYKCYPENDLGKEIVLMMDKNITTLNVNIIIQLIYKEMDEKFVCHLPDKPELYYDKETIIIDYKSKYEFVYSLILRRVNSQDKGAFACGVNNHETRQSEMNTTEQMLILEEKIDFEENIYVDHLEIDQNFWIAISGGVTALILIVIIVGVIVRKIIKNKRLIRDFPKEVWWLLKDNDSLSEAETSPKATIPPLKFEYK